MQFCKTNACYTARMEVDIQHAKANLSKLILEAEAGEEVIISRSGKAVVKLVSLNVAPRRMYSPGALKGRLRLPAELLAVHSASDHLVAELLNESPVLSSEPPKRSRRKAKPTNQ